MAGTDEVLGISGQINIEDIETSLKRLTDNLSNIGIATENLSERTTAALQKISNSSSDAANKQIKTAEVLKGVNKEVVSLTEGLPERIRASQAELTNIGSSIAKIQDLRNKATDSKEIAMYNAQLQSQSLAYNKLQNDINLMSQAYSDANLLISNVANGISIVNSVSTINTATVTAGAVAHGATAVAVGAESAAHLVNSGSISKENDVLSQNTEATKENIESKQNLAQTTKGVAAEILEIDNKVAAAEEKRAQIYAKLDEGNLDIKEATVYQKSADEYTKIIEELKEKRNELLTGLSDDEKKATENTVDSIKERIEAGKGYESAITTMIERIKSEIEEYQKLPGADESLVNRMQARMDFLSQNSSYLDYANKPIVAEEFEKLSDEEEKLTDAISEHKQVQRQANEEVDKSAQKYEMQQMSVSQLREELSKTKVELDKLIEQQIKVVEKSPYKNQKKDIDELDKKIEELRTKQKALNQELEGRSGFSKTIANIKGVFKNIGDNIKGLKSSISQGIKAGGGGLQGIFTMLTSTKVLGWGAAIGVVAGTVKKLNDEAESLHLALNKLKPYVDDDTLGKLRQSFINTALNGSAQSTEDMAAAATHWVRYYETIRKTPEAIQAVVDASRELATLTGQTAEKSADQLTKIAGQYHLNAFEAKQAVNVIANATVKSTVSMTEMISALKSSGQRAKQMGTSFKEMAAVIAMSSQNFPSASSAASSYLMVLQRLSRQTKDEYNPLVVGATKALENLNKAHLSGAQIQKMFGVRIANQARYFIENANSISKYSQDLDSAEGKNKALARAEQTAEYNQKALSNSIAALAKTININITPALNTFVQWLIQIINFSAKASYEVDSFFHSVSTGFKNFRNWADKNIGLFITLEKGFSNFKKYIWDTSSTGASINAASAVLYGAYTNIKSSNDKTAKNVRQRELESDIDEKYDNVSKQYPGASQKALTNMIRQQLYRSKRGGNYDEFNFKDLSNAVNRKVSENWELSHAKINGFDTKIGKENRVEDANKNKAQEQQNKRDEQFAKERIKKEQENAKIELQLANLLEQNKINTMANGAAKQRRQAELDHQKRLQQIKQQAQQYLNANIASAEAEYNNRNPKASEQGKGFYTLGLDKNVVLSDAQTKLINTQYKAERLAYEKQQKEILSSQSRALREYLKEYGTMQERRLAIAKEYDEKINASATEGERLTAQAQKARALSDFDFENIKSEMNWEEVFGNLGSMAKEQLERIKEQLKGLLSTGDLDVQGYKDVVEQIDKVNDAILTAEDKQHGFFGVAISYNTERRKLEMDVADALERQNQAYTDMLNAQAMLDFQKFDLQQQLGGMGIDVAQSDINTANSDEILNQVGDKYGIDSEQYKKVQDALSELAKSEIEYNNAVKKNTKSTNEAQQKQAKLNAYLSNFSEKLKGILPLLQQINANIQDLPGLLSTMGVSEDSAVGKGVSDLASGANSAMGAAADFMSGNYVGAAMNAIKAVGSFGNGVSNLIGMGDGFSGSNAKEVAETIENNTKRNEILTQAIKDLTEELQNQKGAKAIATAEEALKDQEEKNANLAENAYAQMTYHGHHHSFNSKWSGFTDEEIAWVNQHLSNGETWNGDIHNLTPEVAKLLRSNVEMWDKIGATGKGGYGERVQKYISALADEANATQEIIDQLNEALTTTTKEDIFDDFLNSLNELASGSKDVFDEISSAWQEMVNKMVVTNLIGANYQERINKWLDDVAQLQKDKLDKENPISDAEYKRRLDELKRQREQWVKEANEEIEAYRKAGIIQNTGNYEQSASAKGVSSITYDQANYLVNLATARNIALEQGNQVRQLIQLDTSQLRDSTMQIQSDISVMRDIQEQGLTQITRIEVNTRPISQILSVVQDMYQLTKDNI